MAFLTRIGKSNLSRLSLQCKSVSHGSLLLLHLNQAVSQPKVKPLLAENLYQAIHNNHADFVTGVRFFAAPVQFLKQKKEPTGTRINEEITAEVVRLVIDDEHSVVTRREALFRAKQANLDLVEVNSKSDPPVCKIVDYHKEKVDKETRAKERSKSKGEMTLRLGTPKEIRFSVKTERKDLEMKALKIKKLMEDGYKVKCTTKGSSERDVLGTLSRLCDLIGDIAAVDSGPTLGKDSSFLVVKHIKYGQKGRAKKLTDIVDGTSRLLVAAPEADEKLDFEVNEEGYADQVNRDGNEADIQVSDRRHTERLSTVTSPRAESSSEARNRYSGTDWVQNQLSPAKRTDHQNPGTGDGHPMRPGFQFLNQRRQTPRDTRFAHQTRETREGPTNAPAGHGVESGPGENREYNRYGTRHPGAAGGGPAGQARAGRSRQEGHGGLSR